MARSPLHPPELPKVFCIGFQKTGTTSLAAAFQQLGYRVTGPNGIYDEKISEHALDLALSLVLRFDVFQDNPWPILFRELDARFPGSRFILTTRDPDTWLDSVTAHFGGSDRPMLRWIYGVGDPRGNERAFVDRFVRHEQEVLTHFAGRPDDLLVLDVSTAEWSDIGRFLGIAVPEGPLPHANRAAERSRWDGNPVRRTYGRLRAALRRER